MSKTSELATAKSPTGFDPNNIKVVKKVTFAHLKLTDGVPVYITFNSEIYKGKEIAQKGDEVDKKPADLAHVTNLQDGQEYEMIVNAVLKSTLEENYENAGYVGKSFMVQRDKIEGKRYKGFSVTEIEA